MSVKDAKTLVSRTEKDTELREKVRKAYPDKVAALGKEHGLTFTKDEFEKVLQDRLKPRPAAKQAAGKKGPGKKPPGHKPGGGPDKPDICYCI